MTKPYTFTLKENRHSNPIKIPQSKGLAWKEIAKEYTFDFSSQDVAITKEPVKKVVKPVFKATPCNLCGKPITYPQRHAAWHENRKREAGQKRRKAAESMWLRFQAGRQKQDIYSKSNPLGSLVRQLMIENGQDPNHCAQCGAEAKCVVHHTKYKNAAIKNLRFICHKCNSQFENRYLR